MKKIIDFLRDEEGAALPEYALLVALIAVVCVVAIQGVGDTANDVFEEIETKLSGAAE
jgi:pilus assembly protein Flp/PilA